MPEIDRNVLLATSKQDLIDLAVNLTALKKQASQVGPQTRDELHAFIKAKWGYHIPRIAVDTEYGHCAPFDFIYDVFTENIKVTLDDGSVVDVSGALVIANREGAKTTDVGIIHALNARFKPGYWGISSGAVQEQSNRSYDVLLELNSKWGGDGSDSKREDAGKSDNPIVSSFKSITRWANKSKVNVIGGTKNALNGPHSHFLHRDEGDLFKPDAFDEGDNITKSGFTTDGKQIKAIDVVTSSLKFAIGIVQRLRDEAEASIKNNTIPRYKIYKWGIAETIAPVPNCRYSAPPGTPEHELCPCNRVVKGEMADGSPRTLEKICAGRFSKSDGWRPLQPDIVGKFLSNSPAMWEAQQESRKAAAEGLILPNFTEQTHTLQNFIPDPENGKIYEGIDAGGTNAHACLMVQYLEKPAFALGYDGEFMIIPRDSYVVFDEVYFAEEGNNFFARAIKAKEAEWKRRVDFFDIEERYMDIAAKAARLDFRQTHELKTYWRVTREIEMHIDKIVEVIDCKPIRFYVVNANCPMTIAEAQAWQRDPVTNKQIDKFNHAMSALRYVVANIDRKLMAEGRHPDNRKELSSIGNAPIAAGITKEERDVLPGSLPDVGPNYGAYLDGGHDEGDNMPMHQGAMSGLMGMM